MYGGALKARPSLRPGDSNSYPKSAQIPRASSRGNKAGTICLFRKIGGSNRRCVSISRSFHAVMLLIEFRNHQKLVVDNKLLI